MILSPQTKDLGKIKFGKPFAFTFDVVNTKDVPVEITKIGVGCTSCTKAYTDKTKLAPGESSIVNVIFTPGTVGPQSKYVNIVWNGVQNAKFHFTAESYV